jgi:hypothetical protein
MNPNRIARNTLSQALLRVLTNTTRQAAGVAFGTSPGRDILNLPPLPFDDGAP